MAEEQDKSHWWVRCNRWGRSHWLWSEIQFHCLNCVRKAIRKEVNPTAAGFSVYLFLVFSSSFLVVSPYNSTQLVTFATVA